MGRIVQDNEKSGGTPTKLLNVDGGEKLGWNVYCELGR